MKLRKSGDNIIYDEILSPDMVVAKFTDVCSEEVKAGFVLDYNFGVELLFIYEQSRNNTEIAEVVRMLDKMEAVYKDYYTERFNIKRQLK